MQTRTRWLAGAALAVLIALGGAGLAIANRGGKDTDTPLRGNALERATQAALVHTSGGTVIETEIGDGGAAYSVEIRREDGTVVEVQLDSNFQVSGQELDDDGAQSGGADDE